MLVCSILNKNTTSLCSAKINSLIFRYLQNMPSVKLKFITIPSHQLHFWALVLLAISMPLSKFTMSVAQIVLAANWVLTGNFKARLGDLFQNKIALVLMSIYGVHLLGLINTSNFDYALNDLKIKLPILIFPFILGSSQALNRKEVNKLLLFLWAATLLSSLVSMAVYFGALGKPITDVRQLSPLISHIRLALLVCFSVGVAFYFFIHHDLINTKHKSAWRFVLMASVIWMIAFLVILESLTGLGILLVGFLLYGIWQAFNKHTAVRNRVIYASTIIMVICAAVIVLNQLLKPFTIVDTINVSALPEKTAQGNIYRHLLDDKFTENGHFYGLYQCEPELKKEWNKRSQIHYDSLDKKEQLINSTILRYLSSKNLPKDSVGVWQLSQNDIAQIESGIANYLIPDMNPIESRSYQLFFEYQSFKQNHNSSGHSVTMRILYWQAAWLICKDNFFTGVGTGDLEDAFQAKYKEINTDLAPNFRHRAHNQYLTMFVAFGLFGFLFFMCWLIAPYYMFGNGVHPLYNLFFFIFLASMMFEDTLETQAGVTFVVFFSSLFLLEKRERSSIN